MTRENKLALVVGFGLILFVGILISDHFATAGRTEPADLGRELDSLAHQGWKEPTLIDAKPELGVPPLPTAVNPSEVAIDRTPPDTGKASRPIETIEMGSRTRPLQQIQQPQTAMNRVGGGASPPQESSQVPVHRVRSGESLASISRGYYGTDALYKALAEYNRIADPNTLRAGQSLQIPPVGELMPGFELMTEPAIRQPSAAAPPRLVADTAETYEVQSGDTLMEISQSTLGSVRYWKRLYELNKTVIKDPDNLVVGTTLRIPTVDA